MRGLLLPVLLLAGCATEAELRLVVLESAPDCVRVCDDGGEQLDVADFGFTDSVCSEPCLNALDSSSHRIVASYEGVAFDDAGSTSAPTLQVLVDGSPEDEGSAEGWLVGTGEDGELWFWTERTVPATDGEVLEYSVVGAGGLADRSAGLAIDPRPPEFLVLQQLDSCVVPCGGGGDGSDVGLEACGEGECALEPGASTLILLARYPDPTPAGHQPQRAPTVQALVDGVPWAEFGTEGFSGLDGDGEHAWYRRTVPLPEIEGDHLVLRLTAPTGRTSTSPELPLSGGQD